MIYLFADAIGYGGVALILLAYFLLQNQRIDPKLWRYSALNVVGAAFILFSLIFNPNRPAIVIESVWLVISLYGLWRARH